MNKIIIKQDTTNQSDSAAIEKESSTLKLSSDSLANEQENVSKYMNYPNACSSYLRWGKTGGPIRFYPDAQTAYTSTMTECASLLSQGVSGIRSSFVIEDNNHNIIYEGEPKMNGKIKFSIYDGESVTRTVNVADYYSTSTNSIKNNTMNTIEETKETTVAHSMDNNFEEGAHAETIKLNAGIFIDNNILTKENVNFLCLSEDAVRNMAKAVQNTAIINKDAEDDQFESAIHDTSLGMLTVTKKLASGNPTDESHCSMHDDLLYCAAHCKSSENMFNGSNRWRKTPGKLNYNKLEDAILDMYDRGRKMILNVAPKYQEDTETHKTPILIDDVATQNTITTETPIINETVTAVEGHHSFEEVVQAITSTVMTHATSSIDIRSYLKMKGVTLESDIKSLTNNVMTIDLTDNHLTFSLPSCDSKELSIEDYPDSAALKDKVRAITVQLLIYGALSSNTRDSIANVFDLNSIGDYISLLLNKAA